jgi:hypothetical protein
VVRRRRAHRRWAAALVVLAVPVAAVAGVVGWLRAQDAPPAVSRCAAELDGTTWYLDADQADNAALLVGTSLRRALPARAATIALATALQESKLRNITHGDRDSVGLFQQRPSQGWGTAEQILDPVYATNAFYDALVRVDGYQDLPITQAAQAVQRSAYPDAYAQHETRARAWASALHGYASAAVTCTLPAAGAPGDPQAVLARLDRDLGLAGVAEGVTVVVDAAAVPGADQDGDRAGWAVAQWAVAVASTLDVVEVRHAGQVWSREAGTWSPADGATRGAGTADATQVAILVAS